MDWGMQNRLSRIIKPKSGHCVMLAVDHGYFGNIPGTLKCFGDLNPLFEHADALMLTRGMLRSCVSPNNDIPIVLRVSAGASMLKELSNEEINVTIGKAKFNESVKIGQLGPGIWDSYLSCDCSRTGDGKRRSLFRNGE